MIALIPLGLCSGQYAQAQVAAAATGSASHMSESTISPVMGWNGSLDYTAQHDSATGWANIVTPSLSYRFNRHILVDANVPWYLTVRAYVPKTVETGGQKVTTYSLRSTTNTTADMDIAGYYEAKRGGFLYLGSGTLALPTGNARFGLSAKQTTYNVTNHLEYQWGPFIPDVEIGEGDSSALANRAVRKAYVAVGPLANFQAGSDIELPFDLDLDLEAYEDLPIGSQSVYGTVTRKHHSASRTETLDGAASQEDNGFIGELDIPVGEHFVVAGTYERSLIQGLDTASAGVTWTFRTPKLLK